MSEEADTVETQETPAEQPESGLLPTGELQEGEYFLSDGVKGVGEAPEWYKANKYKSVADQAKAYTELEKKLGAFTGAPEEYQVEDDFSYLKDDPMYQEFQEFAKESGMSQEAHDKLVATFLAKQEVDFEQHKQQQLQALGQNAQQRIASVDNFLKGNLSSEQYEKLAPFISEAGHVELVETLVKALRPAKLPVDGGDNPTGITPDKIKEMQMAVDEHGRRKMDDPEYANMVRKAIKDYYGE